MSSRRRPPRQWTQRETQQLRRKVCGPQVPPCSNEAGLGKRRSSGRARCQHKCPRKGNRRAGESHGQEQFFSSAVFLGLLRQLQDEMSADRLGAQQEEADWKADHAAPINAKKIEVASLTVTTQTTRTRQGGLGVEVQSRKGDLTDTQSSLAADQELAAKLAGQLR